MIKVENLVDVMGLNSKFFEQSTEITGHKVRPIPDEGSLNVKTLLYDVIVDEGGSATVPVRSIRWDARSRALILTV